jgi:hypothetical protein
MSEAESSRLRWDGTLVTLTPVFCSDYSRTDYAYRLFVEKPVWSQVLAGLAEETDYDNFKSEVARHQGRAGAAYEHSLHEVWASVVLRFVDRGSS